MHRKSVYRKILILLLCLNIIVLLFFIYKELDDRIPDKIKIMVGENEEFNFNLPISADFASDKIDVISVNNQTVPTDQIKLDLNKPFSIKSTKTGQYKINLKLFGIINFKQVELGVINVTELIPCGNPVGIYIETDGVLVLGTGVISGEDGLNYEPSLNKLKSGDYITAVNDKTIRIRKN
jgi:stage IV sporulation protein B